MKKFAVILAGCGSKDGTEIHESTMILLSIKQLSADYMCFSFNKSQYRVVNFMTGEKLNEKRNMLLESARIARGDILDITQLDVNKFDGIIIPGGLGTALNISTFGLNNDDYIVDSLLQNILLEFKKQNKVICAACIAPMILAKVFKNITITLGNDKHIKTIVEKLGNNFQETKSGEICIDKTNKIVTAPFYMLADNIKTIYDEAYMLVKTAIEL